MYHRFNALYKFYEYRILKTIRGKKYDLFLLIRGEVLSETFIQRIIQDNLNPQSIKVYYSWDSIANLPNLKNLIKYFDRSYTFDMSDAKNNSGLLFLPLFYLEQYSKNSPKITYNCKYDLAIVASFSEKKYRVVKKLEELGYNVYHLLYLNPILFWKNKLFNKKYRHIDSRYLSFKTISTKEIISIYNNTCAVLDIPSETQTGLTMRSIECLGFGIKLVTTNVNIKKVDFYDDENIWVLTSDCDTEYFNPPDKTWLKSAYSKQRSDIVEKYSISSWIDTLIGEKTYDYKVPK